ncbi:MAG: hypothetical protein WD883_00400 [Candidatus Colwellbacteria bacterium]
MAKEKKKLDFDLSFLDKESAKSPNKGKRKDNQQQDIAKEEGWNWKPAAFIFISIILAAMAFGNLGGSSSTSNSGTKPDLTSDISFGESDQLYGVGEYFCSSYHYNKANDLEPSSYEAVMVQGLENELINLSYEVNEHSPQYRIDEYNSKLAEYNSASDSYNRKVAIYNSYLINNCSKSRY